MIARRRPRLWQRVRKDFAKYGGVYFLALPVLVWYATFHYAPMYGAQIAFKDFSPGLGVAGSPWIGLGNFRDFLKAYYFWRLLTNTLLISLYELVFYFPAPIILALLLNEVRASLYKKTIQTLTYIPHFISLVVICGIIVDFVKQDGIITALIASLGGSDTNLLMRPELFRTIYVGSEIWQQIGWSSIIYLAALTMVDAELYEAAMIDGAGRWRRTWHITLPSITPTIMVLLILRIGRILDVGFEKIILLYNPTIYETADVISTFVYRKGILNASYSYASAVGLFNSTISCALVVVANRISKKLTDTSLW